jgi:hypothetical protein
MMTLTTHAHAPWWPSARTHTHDAQYAFHSLLKRNEAYSIMREQMEQAAEEERQGGGKSGKTKAKKKK